MTESKKESEKLTIRQVMDKCHISRQACYAAIHSGNLKAHKYRQKWWIYEKDRIFYMANKYNPDKRKFNGEPVHNEAKQEISVTKAAKIACVPVQRIYYLVRTGQLRSIRKGKAYVIQFEILQQYFANIQKEDDRQLRLL